MAKNVIRRMINNSNIYHICLLQDVNLDVYLPSVFDMQYRICQKNNKKL